MCGIVGLFIKNHQMQSHLGKMFKPMLIEMESRGPDSAGVAVYRNKVKSGQTKLSLSHFDENFSWEKLAGNLVSSLDCHVSFSQVSTHCILITDASESEVIEWLQNKYFDVRIFGSGELIEIYKEVGSPESVFEKFDLELASGSHMIGHTRMATESIVDTAGSHPFATGEDLCLVHNGSLSNHNLLRKKLRRQGFNFYTENDTEVAGAYLTMKIRSGSTIREALEEGIKEIDGFYTFCIGTKDGFAVLRDPIACKHAVIAETDDWVAMATEFRAIAQLTDSSNAKIWEPEPSKVYVWS